LSCRQELGQTTGGKHAVLTGPFAQAEQHCDDLTIGIGQAKAGTSLPL
jgi:hypothetical protein